MFSSLVQRVRSYNDLTRSDSDVELVGKVTESEMKRVGSNPEMDPDVEPNKNISWVRGEALIVFYIGIIVFLRVLLWLLSFPPHMAWTCINVLHCIVCFIIFNSFQLNNIHFLYLYKERENILQLIVYKITNHDNINNYLDYVSISSLGKRCTIFWALE